jgi:hypothetical protein
MSHSLRWKHVEHIGKDAGKKLSNIVIEYLHDWVKDHVIQARQHGVFVSEHASTDEFLNYVYPLLRPSGGLAWLFRERWEIIYAFNPAQSLQNADKDVHKALRAMYPEGDRTLMERRSRMRCLNLGIGAKGVVKAGEYDFQSLKTEAGIEGKLIVGSTSLLETRRPRTGTLRRKLADIASFSSTRHLILLDRASEYPIPSLCQLGATIKATQDRFRLILLCSSDINLQNLVYCDKCKLCYEPELTEIVYSRFQREYPIFSRDAIDKILEEGNGVPSKISKLAAIAYGTHKLLRKHQMIDRKFVEDTLGQSK